ncbi:glycosyltransferase [Vibrio cyclitrophicus]
MCASQGQDVSSILKGEVCNIFPPMQNSKFLIVTSQRESFSMVIIEAMLCGCVVISFDCETGAEEKLSQIIMMDFW